MLLSVRGASGNPIRREDRRSQGERLCPWLRDVFRTGVQPGHGRGRRGLEKTATCAQTTGTEYQKWLESVVESPENVCFSSENGDSCLVASAPVKAGEVVLSVAEENWITANTVSQSGIGSAVQDLDPWLQLALFLIYERSKPQSPWLSYIASLPEDLYSPAFWTDAELLSIAGTQLQESAVGYRQFFLQKYQELESSLFKEHPDLFGAAHFSYDAFSWAVGTIRSQIHPPLEKDSAALVPLLSQVRHSRDGNVKLSLESGNVFNRARTLAVVATRDIAPGDRLTMDYGAEKTDSQVALDYGTADLANQQGGFQLALSLPESDKFYDDKLDVMEICGMEDMPCFDFLPNVSPPTELLIFLRLLNIAGEDAFHLEAIFRNEIRDHLAYPLSPENETNVCQTMILGCEEALKAYRSMTDSAQLSPKQQLMQQVHRSTRQLRYMMLQVCLGEQQTLEWIQSFFLRKKTQVDTLEYYAERRLKRLGLLDDEGNSTFEEMWKDGIA